MRWLQNVGWKSTLGVVPPFYVLFSLEIYAISIISYVFITLRGVPRMKKTKKKIYDVLFGYIFCDCGSNQTLYIRLPRETEISKRLHSKSYKYYNGIIIYTEKSKNYSQYL